MRTRVLIVLLGCAVVASAGVAPSDAQAPAAATAARGSPDLTFVSMPDTFNSDHADVSDAIGWSPESPNSINPAYQAAIDTFFDDVAALSPQAVLVAGDTVEGHWGRDTAGTGIFGPVSTVAERRLAVVRAARQYYGEYRERWRTREIPLYPAMGDHEIGDNPWGPGRGWYAAFKHANLGLFKAQWARFFTDSGRRFGRHPRGTAFDTTTYATMLDDEVLLLSLDVFRKTPRSVVASVGRKQLAWVEGQLKRARRLGLDWVVVQGHTPVVGPVRQELSSGLMYRKGVRSPLWRTLRRYDVDFYLAGEVHANTVSRPRDAPIQVAHGGLFRRGKATVLEARVFGRRMDLRLLRWEGEIVEQPPGQVIWQTDTTRNINWDVVYQAGPHSIGGMSVTRSGRVLSATGVFDDPFPR